MIWVFLLRVWIEVKRVFVIPQAHEFLKMDPNHRCPSCGNTSGVLEYLGMMQKDGKVLVGPLVKHTCKVCGFMWGEKAISIASYPISQA